MRRSFFLWAALTVSALPAFAQAGEESPVGSYRAESVSLTSGMDLVVPVGAPSGWTGFSTRFGNSDTAGIVGIDANVRLVVSGVVLGAQLGVAFYDQIISDAIFVPGLSVGYAIPLSRKLALTPSLHSVFLLSTAGGASPDVQLTAEAALEWFLARQAFIEPVLAMGDYQDTGAGRSGTATFIFGIGYRLGVVF
ncbi:MAG: hypothetical protein ACLQVI_09220 [Polyangiaceae bacterium]|jgi:hypothetical protein